MTEQIDPKGTRLLERAQALRVAFAPRAAHWDKTRLYPWENVQALCDAGLMGMTIAPEYGGQGASFLQATRVVAELAKGCALSARIVVEANMGAISAVMAYASETQKRICAPLVLAGDKPAICITEPEAGSAATQMQTTARRVGSRYVLNGTKHWITGGGVSKIHLIFARVLDESGQEEGISGFVVIHDPAAGVTAKGFSVGDREHTMGLCGMPEAELRFEDLEVEADQMIVPPRGVKHGFSDLMTAYNAQRVGAGAVALGIASGAFERARDYLTEREQFGRPLAEFQGLQWMLADMDVHLNAGRLLLEEAARSANPFPDAAKAARAKLFASEQAIGIVNDALQMFGARGYSDREPLERMYRDVRMFTIGGGTAQILRNQIAGAVLGARLPQTRDGYAPKPSPLAAE